MPWWRFWDQSTAPPAEDAAPPPEERSRRSPRRPGPPPGPVDDAARRRVENLRKRRDLVAFDLERAESATRPDNPWQERIALLGESIATVEADLARLAAEPPTPSVTLPVTPIGGIAATADEPATVEFVIGPERFRFEEETDWDQRGGPRVRGDLQRRVGDAAALVPADIPPDLRDPLARHLTSSVAVFATDLRDRALDGEPLPPSPTLADLARPCPDCGGWSDWRGTCDACAQRAWKRQQLDQEIARLDAERAEEAEERHRWADRLPIARRRLADVDAEIARAEVGG